MEVCKVCRNTGMRPLSTYLDCTDCNSAVERAAFNKWRETELNSIGTENDDWAIHQRALAMAPKQEAPAVPTDADLNHAFDYVTKHWAYVRNENILRARAYFKAGYRYASESAPHPQMSSADIAAPAAANGALTDAQIDAAWDSLPGANIIQGQNSMNWNSLIRRAFARSILAAAGPDAALVKALEKIMRPYGIYDVAVSNAGALQLDFIEIGQQVRVALSGAKGN